MQNTTVTLTKQDLKKAKDLILTDKQLNMILGKTPEKYIKKRPGKGGKEWDYVDVAYITKCLNLMFGWDWDFEIMDEKILDKQVIVKGKLTCRSSAKSITKMQYGRKDIAFLKNSTEPLDLGNDLKSAASDSLKKCASLIGIASDIYGGEDFKEVKVIDELEEIMELYKLKKEVVSPEEQISIERIIDNKEENSYVRVRNYLKNL